MQILTPRLLLRLVEPADQDDLHRLEQDPEVMRHLNGGMPTPLEPDDPDASPYRMPRGGEPDVWAVALRNAGSLVGWVALHVDDKVGEIGYRFFRSAWGQGYATEAARAIMSAAFEQFGLEHIIAQTMAVNARSRRVMERLGMQHAETRFIDGPVVLPGAEHGDVIYVLERGDWRP
jgi:RimJ/RimL family protein N-acetyltransferase